MIIRNIMYQTYVTYLIALNIVSAKDKNAKVLKPLCAFEDISSWQTLLEDNAP